MTSLRERDAMTCRACGNEERASEGYPCVKCGTFVCVVCNMDDLVEVEGEPEEIERAIAILGLPRAGFNTDRLPDFVMRFEQRTGERALISDADLSGESTFDHSNA